MIMMISGGSFFKATELKHRVILFLRVSMAKEGVKLLFMHQHYHPPWGSDGYSRTVKWDDERKKTNVEDRREVFCLEFMAFILSDGWVSENDKHGIRITFIYVGFS